MPCSTPSRYEFILTASHLLRFVAMSISSSVRFSTSSTSASTATAFQLRVDPLTGASEWVAVHDEPQSAGGEEHSDSFSSKSLLATTSYLDMLNDTRRNRAFRRAIDAAITRPCHVLDIGAGTGLLSMMAARAMENVEGGERGQVSACESYLPMGKLMRKILRANGMDNKVKIFHKRSDELHVGAELGYPADMLVSEILDSELLGEGLIPTLQHAHDALLIKNPLTIPHRATIYGQLAESRYLQKLHDLYKNDRNASDGIRLTLDEFPNTISVKPQYAVHVDALWTELQLLSEPFKVFEIDMSKRPDSHGETEMKVKATSNGKVDAIISWWLLQLDSAGTMFYSTAPRFAGSSHNLNLPEETSNWCDHWKQCVWLVREEVIVVKDEYVSVRGAHNETSVSYHFLPTVDRRVESSLSRKSLLTLFPEKIASYGDKGWRMAVIAALRSALAARSSPCCVVTDDSLFLTIALASISKSSTIIAFFPGLRREGASYIQAVADANGFSADQIEVIGQRASCCTDKLSDKKIHILLAEPFYRGSEGALPWKNLRFWKERTMLDSFLAEDALIMPCKGILKICAFSLPDLWRSRRSLGNIEGFNHSSANQILGACGGLLSMQQGPCLPYYVWQCGRTEKLSSIYSLMEFDFRGLLRSSSGKIEMTLCNPGVLHGFVLWIDWMLDERHDDSVLSTGPESRYWKQGVQLLSEPVDITVEKSAATVEATFDSSSGEISIKSSFPSFTHHET